MLGNVYSLMHKGNLYDKNYIQADSRNSQKIREEENENLGS